MPVHGGALYLGATLASAAAEAPDGVEFRLYNSLDDGGAARAIAGQFADRLDIVWQDVPDLKAWTAKTNLGVREARAAHVAMLHQDDLWCPGHCAALREGRAAAPDAALSISSSHFVGPDGEKLGPWRLPFTPGRQVGLDVARTLLVQNSIAIPAPMIARAAWAAVGGLDDALWYTADWDLYLKLAEKGDVWVREGATTAFRVHTQSLTMTGSRDAAAFRAQHELVLARHMPGLAPPRAVLARARAGVTINCALAVAANGRPAALITAGMALARLGPGALRYLYESRLIDRLGPRLGLNPAGRILARGLELLRYAGGAMLAVLANFFVLVAGDHAGLSYPALLALTWLIGGSIGYLWHAAITFSAPRGLAAYAWFMAGVLAGVPATAALLYLFGKGLGWPMVVVAPLTMVLMFLPNFLYARWAIHLKR